MWYIFETKKIDYVKYTVVHHDNDGVGLVHNTKISMSSLEGAYKTIASFENIEWEYVENHSEYIGNGLYRIIL